MATTEVSRLHRTRPWLAERAVRKDPATRFKSTLRKAKVNAPLNAVFAVVNLATGKALFVVFMVPIVAHAGHQWWHMTKHPQAFYDKDAATRALVADYHEQVAAGTWTGPRAFPLRLVMAPLGVGLQGALGLMLGAHLAVRLSLEVAFAAGVVAYLIALLTVRLGFRMEPARLAAA
jgi:hypothetical protein